MTTTPIRRQYLDIKRRFPQAIVFFRLGDFYETFDDDAKLVARELDITLTSKPMGKNLRVPLAGVPHHALQTHLRKLVGRGFKVAICEQTEDPKQAKGLVRREVIRVVTPGTVVEEALLSAATNNYLAALAPPRTEGQGLAYIDITTGEFGVATVAADDLASELARLAPAEVLVAPNQDLPPPFDERRTELDPRRFAVGEGDRLLRGHFGVASLDSFGLRGQESAVAAAGAVLAYLSENQRAALQSVRDLRVFSPARFLVLDANARRHLELFSSLRDGSRQGSLIEVIDATRTAMGGRLLGRWLGQPLIDVAAINERLDRVEVFVADGMRRANVRDLLRDLPDLERIVGRVIAGSAAPRDLAGLRRGLAVYPRLLAAADAPTEGAAFAAARAGAALLEAAIDADPAPTLGEGGVIRAGFSEELDAARDLAGDTRHALAALEAGERERSGIRSLRVAFNRVFGYYIEVSNANRDLVPADYERRQTLVAAERYVTPQLKELEERILGAKETVAELEVALFQRVCDQLATADRGLGAVATAVAELDVYSALAETAASNHYVRPEVDDGEAVIIRDGRHPVVERGIGEGHFVPNDVALDTSDCQIVLVTGPNMAGKSTYLRQVALIALLAQVGSFVPAAAARIGVVDRIFTRIGAQDDLSRGESTFMVEMIETAAILRNATRRSLVVFDEVGRGTSTYDGLAIARAVVEYLHARPERAAKTLFATHYHEMTRLADLLPRLRNFSVAVAEQEGGVVFLYRILPGGADRSYGIHVAELAGMPASVIERARAVLGALEEEGRAAPNLGYWAASETLGQLPLVGSSSGLDQALADLDLDEMTPIQALTRLYELRARARRES